MNAAPSNEYERFLAALPEGMRAGCRERLAGSGISPDHPVFKVLAEVYAQATPTREQEAVPDFLEEAQLHSQMSKQLLAEFGEIPRAVLARIEPQLVGLFDALTAPVTTLTATATDLQRNVEALPHLFGARRGLRESRGPWIVAGTVSAALAVVVTTLVLYFGASSLSRRYEETYQQRLATLEAGSADDTVTLSRLATAGISLKLERGADGDSYFLVLRGARKAAQPISSTEGLAVQIWP